MPTEEELEERLTEYLKRGQDETLEAIESIRNQGKPNKTKEKAVDGIENISGL